MAWEGPGVVASARKLIGVTNSLQAEPGTIHGDFGVEVGQNVVHGTDSPENGEHEIALWFKENGEHEIALWFKDSELMEWEQCITPCLRE
jgi:nucleoside-diphosphate kinase